MPITIPSSSPSSPSFISLTLSLSPHKTFIPSQTSYFPMYLNYKTNYFQYIYSSLESLSSLPTSLPTHRISFLKQHLPSECISYFTNRQTHKQLIFLDLDETLIHADIHNEFEYHDTFISFKDQFIEHPIKINITFRPNVHVFLEKLSQFFDIAIFTSAVEEYADAIVHKLEKGKNIIKFILNRNHCLNYGDLFYVKDLRIIEDYIGLDKVVIVDNNIYSFCNQLQNGVLIHSFFDDKEDDDLGNVFMYLISNIYGVNDVRDVNENMFKFKYYMERFRQMKYITK